MRIRFLGIGILVALLVPAAPALAANQTVTATGGNSSRRDVGVNVGDMVTWNNGGGFHNVHFDDNSFDMPAVAVGRGLERVSAPSPPRAPSGTTARPTARPTASGMSGTVAVNAGYARPAGASPVRTSLGSPTSNAGREPPARTAARHPSCNPPAQESDWLTVGTPDANGAAANSTGSVTLKTQVGRSRPARDDANVAARLLDDRRAQQERPDRLHGPATGAAAPAGHRQEQRASVTEPATGDTTFTFTIPCAGTGDTASDRRARPPPLPMPSCPARCWRAGVRCGQLGKIQVFDGGSDGVASTAPNTLFADQGVFVP